MEDANFRNDEVVGSIPTSSTKTSCPEVLRPLAPPPHQAKIGLAGDPGFARAQDFGARFKLTPADENRVVWDPEKPRKRLKFDPD